MKTVTRRGANHGLHLVLSVLTLGVWAFTGWPVAAAMGRRTVTRSPIPHAAPQMQHHVQIHGVMPAGRWVWNPYGDRWDWVA